MINFYLGDLGTHSYSLLTSYTNVECGVNTDFHPSPTVSDVASEAFICSLQQYKDLWVSFRNPQSVYR